MLVALVQCLRVLGLTQMLGNVCHTCLGRGPCPPQMASEQTPPFILRQVTCVCPELEWGPPDPGSTDFSHVAVSGTGSWVSLRCVPMSSSGGGRQT